MTASPGTTNETLRIPARPGAVILLPSPANVRYSKWVHLSKGSKMQTGVQGMVQATCKPSGWSAARSDAQEQIGWGAWPSAESPQRE